MAAGMGTVRRCWGVMGIVLIGFLVSASLFVRAEPSLRQEASLKHEEVVQSDYLPKKFKFLEKKDNSRYQHHWPRLEFGWRIAVGTIVGFFGAAFGSVGGVGGGGIFVPMLTLIAGFDPKSSTAISKCMITGAAVSTVYYNINLRHPTLDLPIIDYDLALLFQPMLVLGISIGVAFNVILADWMITVLLIIIFVVMSTKAFLRGLETWKKETIIKREAARRLEANDNVPAEVEYKPPPDQDQANGTQKEATQIKKSKVPILENIYWKELGLMVAVWIVTLALQISKNYTRTCSFLYWALNILQIPVAGGVTAYEAVSLYKGSRKIASMGEAVTHWKVHKLVLYCACGLVAGIVGGLLGLGGGFILGPLLLELGIPPQVSTATTTFAMMFSASMSVIEYYLLKRFPVPYALYLVAVATIAALVGQHVVRKAIDILGRASILIFILAGMIFVSAISLGGVGIANMVKKIEKKEYMGFDDICSYQT